METKRRTSAATKAATNAKSTSKAPTAKAPKGKAPEAKASKAKSKTPPKPAKTKPAKKATQVNAWLDDPGSGAKPDGGRRVKRPAPSLGTTPLALAIENPSKAPKAALYRTGTAGFRYWTAAEALRRAADFWGVPLAGTEWQPGGPLPVDLDHGVDLNAFYDRVGLRFFHDRSGGRTVYSGESPDVACHELGHAVLDAIKPGLWDTAAVEVGSFHESFGDISAMLAALQLPQVRAEVLADTGGSIARASRWSRLAEQLGWAIRNVAPDSVDPDCLRNAANSFGYVDPQKLPRSAPSSQLCREVHSFSRVFTGAALDCLAGMLKARPAADDANLLAVSQDFAAILVAAVRASPIVTTLYAEVAAHALTAADASFPGSGYTAALKAGFMKHGILTPSSVATVASASSKTRGAAADAAQAPPPAPTLQTVDVSDYDLGTKELEVVAAADAPRFGTTRGSLRSADSKETDGVDAAKSFLEDLIAAGRVRLGASLAAPAPPATRGAAGVAASGIAAVSAHPPTTGWRFTHEVRSENGKAVLRRLRVSCGPRGWICAGCSGPGGSRR